ncbi:hypothetical protein BT96DRAFT_921788 [Gymnopus androsaceus JB14]|uniref:Uncharacterized protein n=1 Tax=Gymnopus androsaceus JB14 TaxID=1447944 RepID=A0A6A4HGC4_9AGAR|nr:hypothetical protein BT96DRAFT_921788 [Gymnopus androsaceus JB14]
MSRGSREGERNLVTGFVYLCWGKWTKLAIAQVIIARAMINPPMYLEMVLASVRTTGELGVLV